MSNMLIFFEIIKNKFYYKKRQQSIIIKKFIKFVANFDCKFMFFSNIFCEIFNNLTK